MINFFVTRVLFWLVILAIYTNLLISNNVPGGGWFLIVNLLIIILSTVALIGRGAPSYSSYRCVFVFSLILFGITPLFEFQRGITYQYHDQLIFEQYAFTAAIVLLGMICFIAGYRIKPKVRSFTYAFRVPHPFLLVLFSGFCGFLILSYNSYSIISMFVRGGELDQTVGGSSFDLIFSVIIFPVPMCALILYLAFAQHRDPVVLALLVILALFFNFPTGMPRFLSATLYLTTLYAYRPNLFRSRIILPSVILIGVFFIFPLLGSFRNLNSLSDIRVVFGYDIIASGAFDAFQNFVLTIEYLGVSYGYQMLGAIFFFVPRTIWPEKPIDTGSLLAHETGMPHQNIALNYLGEGYANFGISGVVVFGFILGVFCARLDTRLLQSSFRSPAWFLFAAAFPALSFFLMRGGLLSAVAYSVGLLVCFFLLTSLFTRKTHFKTRGGGQ